MALTQIQQGMLVDGILTADTAGRLKMADGFVNDAKISGMAASKLTGSIPTANLPSGTIVQVVTTCPNLAHYEIGSASWVEVTSNFRLSITPKSASNTLLLQATFSFGGNNTYTLSHFKFYDITNSSDVNLPSADGARTPMHGASRQMDGDLNDVDQMVLNATVGAGSTSARTYGLYTKNESGSTTKYFFGTGSNSAAIGIMRPTFSILEIAA